MASAASIPPSTFEPSGPNWGSHATQALTIWMSTISTRRASPGSAPSTQSGPATAFAVAG